jgi:hypothetical protein
MPADFINKLSRMFQVCFIFIYPILLKLILFGFFWKIFLEVIMCYLLSSFFSASLFSLKYFFFFSAVHGHFEKMLFCLKKVVRFF